MALDKSVQSALQQIINRICQMKVTVSGFPKKLQMSACIDSRIVSLMQNLPSTLLQSSCIAAH